MFYMPAVVYVLTYDTDGRDPAGFVLCSGSRCGACRPRRTDMATCRLRMCSLQGPLPVAPSSCRTACICWFCTCGRDGRQRFGPTAGTGLGGADEQTPVYLPAAHQTPSNGRVHPAAYGMRRPAQRATSACSASEAPECTQHCLACTCAACNSALQASRSACRGPSMHLRRLPGEVLLCLRGLDHDGLAHERLPAQRYRLHHCFLQDGEYIGVSATVGSAQMSLHKHHRCAVRC